MITDRTSDTVTLIPGARMTAAEFLALPETLHPLELLEGVVVMSPTPTPEHQDIAGAAYILLWQIARETGGRAFTAPLDVHFDESSVVQPDALYLAPGSRCVVEEKRLVGPPDLVVEVLSPATVRRDRTVKFLLYERHGVREYWLIDPTHRLVEVWRLEGEHYAQQGVYTSADTFASAVLGRDVAASALFER